MGDEINQITPTVRFTKPESAVAVSGTALQEDNLTNTETRTKDERTNIQHR